MLLHYFTSLALHMKESLRKKNLVKRMDVHITKAPESSVDKDKPFWVTLQYVPDGLEKAVYSGDTFSLPSRTGEVYRKQESGDGRVVYQRLHYQASTSTKIANMIHNVHIAGYRSPDAPTTQEEYLQSKIETLVKEASVSQEFRRLVQEYLPAQEKPVVKREFVEKKVKVKKEVAVAKPHLHVLPKLPKESSIPPMPYWRYNDQLPDFVWERIRKTKKFFASFIRDPDRRELAFIDIDLKYKNPTNCRRSRFTDSMRERRVDVVRRIQRRAAA